MAPLQKLGVLGDIHGEDALLERALAALSREGVDLVLSVGDIVDGPGDVERCCRLLIEQRVTCVRGNHERWLLKGSLRSLPDATDLASLSPDVLSFLAELPPTLALDTSAGRLLLCHGVDLDDMKAVRPDDSSYDFENNDPLQELLRAGTFGWMIHGHSHRPLDRRFGRLRVVNAGTLCHHQQPCYTVIDLARGEVRFEAL